MKRVPNREVVVFTRLFATMVGAGLPIVQSLDVLARQTENETLRRVIRSMIADVEAGSSLAGAMSRHPAAFPGLTVDMVAAGEAGGALDTILLRLADYLEKNEALARKVRSALVYPAMIVAVAVPAVVVMMLFVVPTFEALFASAGVSLPLPTRAVIGASEALQKGWWALLGLLLGLAATGRHAWRTGRGRLAADRFMLGVPVAGSVVGKAAVSRFTRTLGTLVASGVPILEGLEITAKTAGNRVVHDAVMRARASIAGGDTISDPLAESGVFPPVVVRMIQVGEQTGALDEMLARIADFHDQQVDTAVAALLSAVEPALVVVLGLVVGGLIVSLYLPIFEMMSAVG